MAIHGALAGSADPTAHVSALKRHHAAHSRPRPRREGSDITRPLQSGAPKFYNAQSHSIWA